MVRRVIADKNFPEKLLLVAGSPDRRQFPDIVVKRADLCGVWDVKFTLVSYGSGGGEYRRTAVGTGAKNGRTDETDR